jgi:CBS domain-containing protein
VNEAAKILDKERIGSVIIMENNKPVGIMTERDFAVKIAANAYPISTKIKKVMSSPVIHISPNESILKAAEIMATKKIRKIPVYEGGKIVGIFTSTNLVNLFTLCSEEDIKKIYYHYLMQIYQNEIPRPKND